MNAFLYSVLRDTSPRLLLALVVTVGAVGVWMWGQN